VRYRVLGRTGLRVSVVGVGTWQLGGEWGHRYTGAEAAAVFDRAGELGVNLVDTAECYGDHVAEELVGSALRGSRDRWVVTTKFGHRFHPEVMQEPGWSLADVRSDGWGAADVVAQLEASLRALGTDHVEVYQAHSGPDVMLADHELWAALGRQVAAGKVRHLGISLAGGDYVAQVRRAAELGVRVVQVTYNRLNRAAEDGVFAACREHDLRGAGPRAAGQRVPLRPLPARRRGHRRR
jgi:aryl-alcohol dehydrogenase-like predicted oxidoreductase